MIKAMQEQQTLIEKLQNDNSTLQSENKTFESRLTALESLLLNQKTQKAED